MAGEKLSRRNFFRLAGGGIAAAVIAPQALLEKVINIPVEFGWTWYVDKNNVSSTLSEIITSTLRQNTQKLASNITANNALLMRLKDGTKVNLQINRISEQAQNERIKIRMQNRHIERARAEVKARLDQTSLDDKNKQWFIDRREAAIRNEQLFEMEDDREVRARTDKLRQDIEDGIVPHPLAPKWKRNGTA